MGAVEAQALLLDSHALLRWDRDVHLLSAGQQSAISNRDHTIFVSAATAWELGIKCAKGKLQMTFSVSVLMDRFGFLELPVTIAHAERAALLPRLHGDPFDRMLVAQALHEGLTLVTVDPMMARYGATVLI